MKKKKVFRGWMRGDLDPHWEGINPAKLCADIYEWRHMFDERVKTRKVTVTFEWEEE